MGWTWKMAWLFVWEGIGRGRGNTRRKEGITIRYEGVGVGVGVARVNTINLTLPYLTFFTFYTCVFHRLSAGYVPVVVRDYMLHTSYCRCKVGGGYVPCYCATRGPPGMTVGDYRSSALYIWSSTAPGGGLFFLFEGASARVQVGWTCTVSDEDGDNTCSKKVHVGCSKRLEVHYVMYCV